MKQETTQKKSRLKNLRSWGLGALLGGGILLGATRIVAGALAKGDSYEAALPFLAYVLPFLGGLASGGLGMLAGKGGIIDGLASAGLLLFALMLSGFAVGQKEISFLALALRSAMLMLGGVLIPWAVSLSRRKKQRGKENRARRRAKRKKS